MSDMLDQVRQDMNDLISEWIDSDYLNKGDLFVIGCSTSEVAGEQIGTSGSEDIAKVIYEALGTLKQATGVELVFQSCEHLNRALVMERSTMTSISAEEVTVIPVKDAGGSMTSYAYRQMNHPVIVETCLAHAGIDIGETLIGMQLKQVVVPLRFKQKYIGNARLTAARTRPKLIGGKRACYDM